MNDFIINFDDLILITGSNGFIGSRVVKTLLYYGFKNLLFCQRFTLCSVFKMKFTISSNLLFQGDYRFLLEERMLFTREQNMQISGLLMKKHPSIHPD